MVKILKVEEMVEVAKKFATEKHKGQSRWNGDPYIVHPERVANKFGEQRAIACAIAWLHDVVEDTDATLDDLTNMGFNEVVVKAVDAISQRKDEPYVRYISRISKNKTASRVKIADMEDNMIDATKQRKEKYELATLFLLVVGLERGK